MTAIFMSVSRNGKQFRKRKAEITGKCGRKALRDVICCISKAKKRHRGAVGLDSHEEGGM